MSGRVGRISMGNMSVSEAAGTYPKTEMDLGHPLEKN